MAIALDAEATLVLTTSRNYAQLKEASSQIAADQIMHWLDSENIASQQAQEWQQLKVNQDTLAYLQYTSGSTSTPKGVMITHGNLMHHAYINSAWGYTPDSIATTWMPSFHDYGLVDGLIQPFYAGIHCYVMSPLAFIKRPNCWLQTISRYKVTHSQGTNFAYEVEEVVGNIREAIALQHELQAYAIVLVKTGSIPKTSSGKIQRHACRTKFLNRILDRLDWEVQTHNPQSNSLPSVSVQPIS